MFFASEKSISFVITTFIVIKKGKFLLLKIKFHVSLATRHISDNHNK